MASGKEAFKQPLPFSYELDGVINGQKFTIKGKGVGDSTKGTLKGRYTCTSGKSPMSWAALSPLLGYGFKCFVNYPEDMVHFYQETMPSGYSEDRVFTYEDNGTVKSHRDISLVGGVVISKGTLVAENFPEGSPILTQNLKTPIPPNELSIPHKDGIKTMGNFAFPTSSGEFYAGALTTIQRPLRKNSKAPKPGVHFGRSNLQQLKDADADENDDHSIVHENFEVFSVEDLEM